MDETLTTYLLTLEVAPMTVGKSYRQLPLHCTVMHRFHSYLPATAIIAAVTPIFRTANQIDLVPAEHVAFGPRKQLATLVHPTAGLMALHQNLLVALEKLGVQHTESDWVGAGYLPHVTDKRGQRLNSTVSSSVAYLIAVEHPLKGQTRQVCQAINLRQA